MIEVKLNDFVNKVVFSPRTGERFVLEKVTAPAIYVATVKPGSFGYPRHYVYETMNGDPISTGILIFEDTSLTEPFITAYITYSRTQSAYFEEISYWMRKD